jgi:hypothetical protein
MNLLPTKCPLCKGEITVTRLHCRDCDTTFDGRFTFGSFSRLTPEQLEFLETFIRCEGKIKRMEDEIGLSYPTIRNRLHEVIRALGYEPGGSEEPAAAPGLSLEERQEILEKLDKGLISAEEAMRLIKDAEE